MIAPHLVIAPSEDRGRGVFTTKSIPADTVIEISPVIVLTSKERKDIEKTKLFHYVFEWGDTRRQACVALGYVSMYNHSYDANCAYEMDFDNLIVSIRTVKKIKKGEELYINYNADPTDQTKVWFDTH
ncbi:SET domain-containing protein-lysine N-methyltransferase [Panacibacter sp. DH6]|uniref:SET domain-containing protein-lysine N-methyltransferase n=1 Tax=Panacibacter microcysteis TaxID=2793269 RepID=A0A931E4J3_9BACT|nr:SET domain-containing protein [Panacibacter microcysteis]MBG9375034.1 SET domain-containing protein-lysine N-methyltransferase [Panacibacter microcysteis]